MFWLYIEKQKPNTQFSRVENFKQRQTLLAKNNWSIFCYLKEKLYTNNSIALKGPSKSKDNDIFIEKTQIF